MDYKEKQKRKSEHKTHFDCLASQNRLIKFFRQKMQSPTMTEKEQDSFPDLIAGAFLSQATRTKFDLILPDNTHHSFNNYHTALLMVGLEWANKSPQRIKYMGKSYEVDIKDVWKQLWQKALTIFGQSQSEARSMSHEYPKIEGPSAHKFSVDEEMK